MRINTQYGLWELSDSHSNKKIAIAFLRAWQNPITGKEYFTYQEISDAFGYSGRQNSYNYWRNFKECGKDFIDFIQRKQKIDADVLSIVEDELKKNVQMSIAELCKRVNDRLGGRELSDANIRSALNRIPVSSIRNEVKRNWEKGTFHPKEEVILERVMSALEEDKPEEKGVSLKLLSQLKIKPSEDEENKICTDNQMKSVVSLLDPDKTVDEIPPLIQQMVFALSLYFWNVPLSRIGMWLGKNKSTIYQWITGLSVAIWDQIKDVVTGNIKASSVYIDEKWLKIKKKWHYWFVAIDVETGLPVASELLPTRTKWSCRFFLLRLKEMGKKPKSIITDGLKGYSSSIEVVFKGAKHILCIFHYQQSTTQWIKKNLIDLPAELAACIKKNEKSGTKFRCENSDQKTQQVRRRKFQRKLWHSIVDFNMSKQFV